MLRQIVIPKVDFTNAPVHEVILFLANEAHTEDERGINIIYGPVRPPTTAPASNGDPFSSRPDADEPRITFHARAITCLDLLATICRHANLEWHVTRDGIVVIRPGGR